MERRGPIVGDRTPARTWLQRPGRVRPDEFGKLVQALDPRTQRAVLALAGADELPCRDDPVAWTTPPGERREGYEEALVRMAYVIDGCNACPAFVECDDLALILDRHRPDVTGVLAGRILDTGVTADKVREALGAPGWP